MFRDTPSPVEPHPADVFSSACESRGALQHLTSRWGALTLAALWHEGEPMRFAAIRRRVDGVSDRMLSQTLSHLERDGMVVRTVHSTIPPNVDYALTPLGRRAAEPLVALACIIESSLPQILSAQEEFDAVHGVE